MKILKLLGVLVLLTIVVPMVLALVPWGVQFITNDPFHYEVALNLTSKIFAVVSLTMWTLGFTSIIIIIKNERRKGKYGWCG